MLETESIALIPLVSLALQISWRTVRSSKPEKVRLEEMRQMIRSIAPSPASLIITQFHPDELPSELIA